MAGKICAICKVRLQLDPTGRRGERLCLNCSRRPTYRVYFSSFVLGNGQPGGEWIIQFSLPSLEGSLGRIRVVRSEQAVRDLIARTPTNFTLADRQALDYAFSLGRGGVFLHITGEQYAKLLR
jgi:hypothetical protein